MLTKACTCHKACYMLLTIVQKPIVGSIATSNDTISVQLKMRLFIFVAFWLNIVVLRVGACSKWALHSIDWFGFESRVLVSPSTHRPLWPLTLMSLKLWL